MLYDVAYSIIQNWSYTSLFVMMIVLPLLVKHSNLHINISVAVTLYPPRKRKG